MYAVEIEGLSYKVGNDTIFANDNLKIPEGDFAVIIGANGGGKSTLIKLILGIYKPNAGEIKIFGKKLGETNIGYVPQDSEQMRNFPITVFDTTAMGLYKFKDKDNIRKINESLEIMGMLAHADKRLNELSTGQRQRVLIARALVSEPKLLLFDEPVSGVDPDGQQLIMKLLSDYRKHATILFVSHNLELIPEYATSVICVEHSLHYHKQEELTLADNHVKVLRHECRCDKPHDKPSDKLKSKPKSRGGKSAE